MKKKRIPSRGSFRVFPATDPTIHKRTDLSSIAGHVELRRHPVSGRLEMHFAAPFADVVLHNRERLTLEKTLRLEAAVRHFGAVVRHVGKVKGHG